MVTFKEEGDTLTCFFSGPMDSINSVEAERLVNEKLPGTYQNFHFDVAKTDFVSSVFLRFCLTMMQRYGLDRFALLHPNETVRKVLSITNLQGIVKQETGDRRKETE